MDTLVEAILENTVSKNRHNTCTVSYITTCKILKYIIDNYKKQTYEIYVTNNSFETQFMCTLLDVSKRIEKIRKIDISFRLNTYCVTMYTSWNTHLNEKYLFTIVKDRIDDVKKVYYEYLNRAKIDESLMNMLIIHVNSPVMSTKLMNFNGDEFEEIENFLVNNMLAFERNNCENMDRNDDGNSDGNSDKNGKNSDGNSDGNSDRNGDKNGVNKTTKEVNNKKTYSGMKRKNPFTGEINYAKK